MIDLAAKPFYLKPEDIEWVNTTLAGMTTEEKAGQLFCVLFKECKPEEFEYVFNILKPGGCMYRVVPTERAIAATQNIYSNGCIRISVYRSFIHRQLGKRRQRNCDRGYAGRCTDGNCRNG